MAKGKLSMLHHGEEPAIMSTGGLALKQARHPLIDEKKVVPTDIYVGTDYRTSVITGPNTGGKTVSLKTSRLLFMMAQTDPHIPAQAGSQTPVFRHNFADIGDEQRLEQRRKTV